MLGAISEAELARAADGGLLRRCDGCIQIDVDRLID